MTEAPDRCASIAGFTGDHRHAIKPFRAGQAQSPWSGPGVKLLTVWLTSALYWALSAVG